MLRSLQDLIGYKIAATDGEVGSVADFYFDDQEWKLRYVVADTGGWLPGRQVLIAPVEVQEPDWEERLLPVSLSRAQIEDSPPVSQEEPVSRQKQIDLARYYNWAPYWRPTGVGPPTGEVALSVEPQREQAAKPEGAEGDPHLRSVQEVTGYKIHSLDEHVGHVEDFIAETDDWMIRYMVVDTRNWLPGRKVPLSPAWVERTDWPKGEVFVSLSSEEIRNSPEYDPSEPVNRDYEGRLFDYYGQPKYWEED